MKLSTELKLKQILEILENDETGDLEYVKYLINKVLNSERSGSDKE